MGLSNKTIDDFVKLVNSNNSQSTPTESTVTATVLELDGRTYVKVDGSDLLTPVSKTTSVKEGDKVTVLVKNHTATVTGNMTDPSASISKVDKQGSKITELEIVMAYKVTTEDLEAVNASIENLKATAARLEDATIVNAQIENLEATFAQLDHITATDIEVITAQIESIEAEFANIENISAEDLEAVNAEITNLKGYTADFTYDLTIEESGGSEDYSAYSEQMYFGYTITLPSNSKIISNNADQVSSDGYTLTWEMEYGKKKDIDFVFTIDDKDVTATPNNNQNNNNNNQNNNENNETTEEETTAPQEELEVEITFSSIIALIVVLGVIAGLIYLKYKTSTKARFSKKNINNPSVLYHSAPPNNKKNK